jgi:hypothetical protein
MVPVLNSNISLVYLTKAVLGSLMQSTRKGHETNQPYEAEEDRNKEIEERTWEED